MVGALALSIVAFLSVPLFSADEHQLDVGDTSRSVVYEVDRVFSQLSLEDKVGMILMPALDAHDDTDEFISTLCEVRAGGFVIIKRGVTKEMIQSIRDGYRQCNPNTKLLIAIDAEPGLISKKLSIETEYASFLQTTHEVEETAKRIAQALASLNIDIAFAPIFDSNANKEIIGDRSFGNTKETIVPKALAFAEVLKEHKVIPTAKHFPGHGAVSGDSHKESVYADGALVELPQFVSAIDAGMPLMMVGHIIVSGGNHDTRGIPASLSREINTILLREILGFAGVLVSDALNMHAVAMYEGAPLRALMSGVDILVMPQDVRAAYQSIRARAQQDAVVAARLDEAVRRILILKVQRVASAH